MFCIHEWVKLTKDPEYSYWDYSGFHVGVFLCVCKLCGKERKRKYI